MDTNVKRALGLAVALGFGLGLMLGAGVWAAYGGPTQEQVVARARRLGMVTPAEADAGAEVLLVVSAGSAPTDVAEALRAAGMKEQASEFVLKATGRKLVPGAYRFSPADSLEAILERLTASP